jgi:RNA polymerase sigma factor (sigma-70 family)
MSPRLSDLLLRSQSDERLVSLARAGHDRAFATIVERYRPELLAMARRLVSDGRAEDVLQQALLSAFAALRSGTEVRHVRGWLYQIVRTAAVKTRPPAEAPLDEMTASGPALEDVVQQRALAMSAMSEISRLPPRQRDALVGSALGGLGRAELAASMGLSEGAVRQLVHRARATVRTAVTAVTPWPLANWLAAVPGGGGTSEVVAAAGALSGGGLAVKLGALLVTGAVATGVAVVPKSHHHRAQASRAATAPARTGTSAHVLGSTVLPAAALRSVATIGPGERHRGGERGDSRGDSRSRGDGSGDSRGGERGDSRGGEAETSDDSRSRSGPSAGASDSDDHGSGGGGGSDERVVTTTASSREDRVSGDRSGKGSGDGSSQGSGDGSSQGSSDGSSQGSSDGSSQGSSDGSSHGSSGG